jgi:tetratricopeptide (TPR) repeat protein
MNIKHLYIAFIFLYSGLSAQAPDVLFDQGNKAYNLSAYEEAITNYKLVLEAELHSSELYFNLANSYYKIGEVGESVFYFEKAKLLDPDNKDIQTNLQFAQNMSLDAIEFLPKSLLSELIDSVTSLFSVDNWSKILIVISYLLSLLFVLYLLNKSTFWKRLYFSSFCLLLIIFFTIFSLTYSQDKEITNQRSGIIFDTQINIWGEPNERSEVLFVLHEGTKVEVIDALGTWNKIKIVNGSEGWVESSSLRMLN